MANDGEKKEEAAESEKEVKRAINSVARESDIALVYTHTHGIKSARTLYSYDAREFQKKSRFCLVCLAGVWRSG